MHRYLTTFIAAIVTSGFAASPSSAQAPLAPQLEATPDASAFVPAKPTDTPMLVHPDGPAPPLTQIFVNNVCNATTCETISSGQPSTVNTYTGASVYVYVWEIGYGNGELATQGGSTIASAYLIGKVPVAATRLPVQLVAAWWASGMNGTRVTT
jgi:Domain of unknown function (DUF4879)